MVLWLASRVSTESQRGEYLQLCHLSFSKCSIALFLSIKPFHEGFETDSLSLGFRFLCH